jgi:leader peptidase (prepilin peptidase)/N-methyltransferase
MMTVVPVIASLTVARIGRVPVTALAGVIGLLVGSFLNVVVYRVPRHLSVVEPRSFCPHCDRPVRSADNIPVVSWIVLGGRCRHCRGPISVRYPLIELGTGISFAAVGWGFGPHWAVAGFCVLAATLIALVAVERDGLVPPLSVAVTGSVIAIGLLVGAAVADRRWAHLVGVLTGSAIAAVLVAVARRVGVGPWADAGPVLLPVAAALGWLGPIYAAEGLGSAVIVTGAVQLARRGRSTPSADPDSGVIGLALGVGAAVATVIAVAVGAGVGT